MKTLLTFFFTFFLIAISSCGSDDSTEMVVNELFFDGTSFIGGNAIAVDVGRAEDHYEFSFAISDGDINYNSSSGSFQFSTSSQFFLSFGAAASGDQFSTGEFEFRSVIDQAPDGNFFFSGTFVDIENSSTLSATGGTVTITGTSPNYTMVFDVTFTGGRNLTGAFVGTFELEEG